MYLFGVNFPLCYIILIVLVFLLYKCLNLNYDYFDQLKVVHNKPVPLFGSYLNLILRKQSFAAIICEQYKKFKSESYFGTFFFRTPVLVITDPSLIRSITITDFDSFANHSTYIRDSSVIKFALTNMKGEKWRNMRETLAPIFNTANIRRMFYLIEESCMFAVQKLKEGRTNEAIFEVDLQTICRGFALDAVASLTLGIKPSSSSKNCEFHRRALNIFEMTPSFLLKLFLYGNFPRIMKFFKIPFIDGGFLSYFYSLVHEIIEYRKKHQIQHYDIIQLLMQNYIQDNSHSNDIVIAQCILLIFGGLLKITDQLSCIILELSVNPDVQAKLLQEIKIVQMSNSSTHLNFEMLNSLEYLDMVIYETLRKWPNQVVIERMCTKPYRLYDRSNKHFVDLKPGNSILIPVLSLHSDPLYFTEPDHFIPERFKEEKRGFIKPYSYLPFGCGPRNCLGAKLAMTLLKAAVYSFLINFHFEPEIESMTRITPSNKCYFLQPDSYKVRFRPRT